VWLSWQVILFECFQLVTEPYIQSFGSCLVGEVGKAHQLKGFANYTKHILHGSGFNLDAASKLTLLDPLNKSLKNGDLFVAMEALKVWLKHGLEEVTSLPPNMILLQVVHCHHAMSDLVVCSMEKMFPVVL